MILEDMLLGAVTPGRLPKANQFYIRDQIKSYLKDPYEKRGLGHLAQNRDTGVLPWNQVWGSSARKSLTKLLERRWTLVQPGVALGERQQAGVGLIIASWFGARMLEFSPLDERV